MRQFLLFILTSLFSVSLFAQKGNIDIVKSSASKYIIIVPQKAKQEEKDAAKLLQDAFLKTFNVKLFIFDDTYPRQNEELLIGNARGIYKNFPAESQVSSYVIKDKKLIFNGKNAYYSVVDFLEREIGIRKFATDCEIFPKKTNLSLNPNLKYSFSSPNVFREVNSNYTKRNKDFQKWLKTDLYTETFARGYYVHTAAKLCSDKEYFNSHPEYFALVNGQRVRDQVCWSNEDVFKIMKTNLQKAMVLQPEADWWSVSQNDNNTYCQCNKCMALINKEGSPAAPIISFVNRMAEEFPTKLISTLAYQYSRKCPKTLKPGKNVQIMLCTIEADRNITIEEEKLKHQDNSFAKDLEDWAKVSKNIYLWDYECDFAHYMCPFPNMHVLQPNIQYFVKNGANMQFQQANCNKGHEFAELKNYLIAKLLWNPKENQDSIINEFMNAYYGKAAKYIREYMDLLENTAISYKNSVVLDIYGPPTNYKDNILSQKNLAVFDSILCEAEKSVQNDKKILLRVQTAHLPVHYALLEIAKADMYSERGFFRKEKGKWIAIEDMHKRLETFYDICKRAAVESLNENGLKPETYYSAIKRQISNDVSNDLAFQKPVKTEPAPASNYAKGDPMVLTDGTRGAADFKMSWLGWWGKDFSVTVDLQGLYSDRKATISSLNLPNAWILHPIKISCFVSADGKNYKKIGEEDCKGNNKNNPAIQEYTFKIKDKFRYIRFDVEGTKTLPSWHASYTKKSWVFLDEITVK
ncbi:MAG: DUF4838 domain-containing protein [Bacteroidales bacterium]|nr:DUF4838 domain-containing protein [Bacteroidales bacterium]